LSNGELYTILTNKAAKGKKGSIVAMVAGTKAESVIAVIKKISLKQRNIVTKITDQEQNLGKSFAKMNIFAKLTLRYDFYKPFKIYAS
jgi:hypothetical protein